MDRAIRIVSVVRGEPRSAAASDPGTVVSLSLRLKDLLGPVTRVKKKKKQ